MASFLSEVAQKLLTSIFCSGIKGHCRNCAIQKSWSAFQNRISQTD